MERLSWLLKVLVTLFIALQCSRCQGPEEDPPPDPGWSIVGGAGLRFIRNNPRGQTYAIRSWTVIAGEDLVEGQNNIQAGLRDCAGSCDQHANCTSFNWCDVQAGCLVGPSGSPLPWHACQLKAAAVLEGGRAVLQLASGSPVLGTAGARVPTPEPPPLAGYIKFPARSLLLEYDFDCNGTLKEGTCALPETLQEAGALCQTLPGCAGFAFLPAGLENSTGLRGQPMAIFKNASSSGGMVDLERSSLSLVSSLYVKRGLLLEPSSTSSGLSSGAIAGIVVGAVVGCSLATIAAVLLWRRRRRRCLAACSATGALEADKAEEQDEEQGTLLRDGGGTAEEHKPCIGRLTPSDSSGNDNITLTALGELWGDVVLPRDAIVLCRDASGELVRLGQGASGQVFRARVHGIACACKVFELDSEASRALFLKEAALLWRISCPSVVHFIGVSVAGNQGLLCMELMESDLRNKLHAELPDGSRLFGWHNRGARVSLQIACALSYLHSTMRLLHLDIKPGNVLLTKTGDAKLADVGFSRIVSRDSQSSQSSEAVGTFDFCAPEVLLGEEPDEKADIWSFGVLLYELCSGRAPRRGSLHPLAVPQDCCQAVAVLQQRCMSLDPQLRPSAAEVVDILHANQPGVQERARQRAVERATAAGAGRGLGSPPTAAAWHPHAGSMVRSVSIPPCTLQSPLLAALHGGQGASAGQAQPGRLAAAAARVACTQPSPFQLAGSASAQRIVSSRSNSPSGPSSSSSSSGGSRRSKCVPSSGSSPGRQGAASPQRSRGSRGVSRQGSALLSLRSAEAPLAAVLSVAAVPCQPTAATPLSSSADVPAAQGESSDSSSSSSSGSSDSGLDETEQVVPALPNPTTAEPTPKGTTKSKALPWHARDSAEAYAGASGAEEQVALQVSPS